MSVATAQTVSGWKSTACILCECNCGIEVQLGGEDGRHFVSVRGDDAHPASQRLCLREGARASTSTRTARIG